MRVSRFHQNTIGSMTQWPKVSGSEACISHSLLMEQKAWRAEMNVSFSHFVTFTIIHLSSSELAFIVFIALYCNDGLLFLHAIEKRILPWHSFLAVFWLPCSQSSFFTYGWSLGHMPNRACQHLSYGPMEGLWGDPNGFSIMMGPYRSYSFLSQYYRGCNHQIYPNLSKFI